MIQQPSAEPIAPNVDVIILDGETVVNMLYHSPQMTFEDYAIKRCVLYISSLLKVSVGAGNFNSCSTLWMEFGKESDLRYIPSHKLKIAASLGPSKSRAVPLFHALTGCDTGSAFKHRGKKTAWETYPNVTQPMLTLTEITISLVNQDLEIKLKDLLFSACY